MQASYPPFGTSDYLAPLLCYVVVQAQLLLTRATGGPPDTTPYIPMYLVFVQQQYGLLQMMLVCRTRIRPIFEATKAPKCC